MPFFETSVETALELSRREEDERRRRQQAFGAAESKGDEGSRCSELEWGEVEYENGDRYEGEYNRNGAMHGHGVSSKVVE